MGACPAPCEDLLEILTPRARLLLRQLVIRSNQYDFETCRSETYHQLESKSSATLSVMKTVYSAQRLRLLAHGKDGLDRLLRARIRQPAAEVEAAVVREAIEHLLGTAILTFNATLCVIVRELADIENIISSRQDWR